MENLACRCIYVLIFQVSILKPMTSCPTSPERFLVCRGFTGCKTILIEVGEGGGGGGGQ